MSRSIAAATLDNDLVNGLADSLRPAGLPELNTAAESGSQATDSTTGRLSVLATARLP